MRVLLTVTLLVFALGTAFHGQQGRPASPAGATATQVGEQWIEITYGRPILRGRTNIFGSGADYGVKLNDGGPVWRAGANDTTLLRNGVALEVGGRRVPAGDHAILIELTSPSEWTFILSDQARQRRFDPNNTTELWGGFNYQPTRDVARAPMKVETLPYSVDQLTWLLTDITPAGGTMRVMWERTMGSVAFRVGE